MELLIIYVVLVNVVAFLLYGFDKWQARKGKRRISEKTLLALAILGGSAGAYVGMYLFHHKTKKVKFYLGIPMIILLQVGILIYFLQKT